MHKVALTRLQELVSLDADTGILYWRSSHCSRVRQGSPAGCASKGGYIRLQIDGVIIPSHRAVWALHTGAWPPDDIQVDHINGDKHDNRPANLRLATNSQNQCNSRKTSGKSGLRGVFWAKDKKAWRASIMLNYKTNHLGYFANKEDAHAAYCIAAAKTHGEFAQTVSKPSATNTTANGVKVEPK